MKSPEERGVAERPQQMRSAVGESDPGAVLNRAAWAFDDWARNPQTAHDLLEAARTPGRIIRERGPKAVEAILRTIGRFGRKRS